jgi:hypothetical protein
MESSLPKKYDNNHHHHSVIMVYNSNNNDFSIPQDLNNSHCLNVPSTIYHCNLTIFGPIMSVIEGPGAGDHPIDHQTKLLFFRGKPEETPLFSSNNQWEKKDIYDL